MSLPPNAYFVAVSLFAGLALLSPLRTRLGAGLYHSAALPVGLLGWALVTALTTVQGIPFRQAAVLSSYTDIMFTGLLALLVWEVARHVRGPAPAVRPSDRPAIALALVVVHVALIVAAAWFFAERGAYYATDDSWAEYETAGIRLYDTGSFYPRMLATRAPLLPAMAAAHRAVGGDFLFAVFPFIALSVLGLIGVALWRRAGDGLGVRGKVLLVCTTLFLVGTSAPFVVHGTLVHSHMLTAAFLVLCVLSTLEARQRGSALLSLAALGAVGVVLARPDGWAYVFVAMVPLALDYLEDRIDWRGLAAFFVPLMALLLAVYIPAFVRLGLWRTEKQSGALALALLTAVALTPVALAGLKRLTTVRNVFTRPSGPAVALLVVIAAGLVIALAVDPARAAKAWENMGRNLFWAGRWGVTWYVLIGFLALALSTPRLRRAIPDGRVLLLVIGAFIGGAMIIHGLAHPGRLTFSDSFNRIAFHITPLLWWFSGAVVAAAWGARRAPGEQEPSRSERHPW